MSETVRQSAGVSLVIALFTGAGFFIGRSTADERVYPKPCWNTIEDVQLEALFQESKALAIASGEPYDEIFENDTLMLCTSYKPWEGSDIVYYREMNREELNARY